MVTGIFVDSAVCTRTEDEVRKKQLFLGNGGGWIRIVLGSIRFTDFTAPTFHIEATFVAMCKYRKSSCTSLFLVQTKL